MAIDIVKRALNSVDGTSFATVKKYADALILRSVDCADHPATVVALGVLALRNLEKITGHFDRIEEHDASVRIVGFPAFAMRDDLKRALIAYSSNPNKNTAALIDAELRYVASNAMRLTMYDYTKRSPLGKKEFSITSADWWGEDAHYYATLALASLRFVTY